MQDPSDPILWNGDFIAYAKWFALVVAGGLIGAFLWFYLREMVRDYPTDDVTKD